MASGDAPDNHFISKSSSNFVAHNLTTQSMLVFGSGTSDLGKNAGWYETDTTAYVVDVTGNIDSTAIDSDGNGSEVVIVGAVCGVVGVILGILFTFMFWSYKNKNKPSNAFGPYRLKPAVTKNPREATFERLDMSLTLDRPDQSFKSVTTTTLPQSSFQLEVNEPFNRRMPRSRTLGCNDYNAKQYSPLSEKHDFDLGKQETMFFKRTRSETLQAGHTGREASFLTYSRPVSSVADALEWEKRFVPISSRGSISSGLGTGAESDVYSFENRNVYFPLSESLNRNHLMVNENTPIMKSLSKNHFQRSGGVENAGYRSRGSTISYNQKSDSTSSTTSGDRSSDHEFIAFNNTSSTNSTISSKTSSNGSNCFSKHDISSIDREKDELDMKEDSFNLDGSSKSSFLQKGFFPKHECRLNDEDEDQLYVDEDDFNLSDDIVKKSDDESDDKDVVSTYFDLRFPSTSLTTNQSVNEDKNSNEFKTELSEIEGLNESEIDNPDEVIQL